MCILPISACLLCNKNWILIALLNVTWWCHFNYHCWSLYLCVIMTFQRNSDWSENLDFFGILYLEWDLIYDVCDQKFSQNNQTQNMLIFKFDSETYIRRVVWIYHLAYSFFQFYIRTAHYTKLQSRITHELFIHFLCNKKLIDW